MTAMTDLTTGTRVHHAKWGITGTIKVIGDVTEIRWDGMFVHDQITTRVSSTPPT